MPVFLKKVKRDLQTGKNLKGNHVPPNYVQRDVKDYPRLKVEGLTQTPRPGIKIMDFSAIVPSQTVAGKAYKVIVQFHDISFTDQPVSRRDGKLKLDSGAIKYFNKPSIDKNPVKLKCQCDDYRHRFEHELHAENGLIGAPRKYTRKTPPWPNGYPYANATDKMGYCKHIHSLLFHLKGKAIITE